MTKPLDLVDLLVTKGQSRQSAYETVVSVGEQHNHGTVCRTCSTESSNPDYTFFSFAKKKFKNPCKIQLQNPSILELRRDVVTEDFPKRHN